MQQRVYLSTPESIDRYIMRFAIAAIDRYLGVFETFVQAGWTPVKLFTSPLKNDLDSQHAVIAYAEQQGAAIQLSQMTTSNMAELRDVYGCEALIVASYSWKIEDWQPFLKYAVNFHASPLPEGRGPYPVIRAIKEGRPSWAVTCHKINSEFDKGDILAVEEFPLQPDECHESLDLKIQMAAKRLAGKVAGLFIGLWEEAKPQGDGSYWKRYKLHEHVIDFQLPIQDVMRHIRAFGKVGSLAKISNTWLIVKQAVGWVEAHKHVPGNVVHINNQSIIVATTEGYVGLLEAVRHPLALLSRFRLASRR